MLLSPKETADLLGVGLTTVYRMKNSGQLPIWKLPSSSRWKVHEDKLKEMINAQAEASMSNAGGVANGGKRCHTKEKTATTGGLHSPTQMEKELDDLLGQPASQKQKRLKVS